MDYCLLLFESMILITVLHYIEGSFLFLGLFTFFWVNSLCKLTKLFSYSEHSSILLAGKVHPFIWCLSLVFLYHFRNYCMYTICEVLRYLVFSNCKYRLAHPLFGICNSIMYSLIFPTPVNIIVICCNDNSLFQPLGNA